MGDCLHVLINLLKRNNSNQSMFVESAHLGRIMPFFEFLAQEEPPSAPSAPPSPTGDAPTPTGGVAGTPSGRARKPWSAQKVRNVLLIMHVLRALLSPSNAQSVLRACQMAVLQTGILRLRPSSFPLQFKFPLCSIYSC